MSEYAVLPLADYVDACDATREMTGETERIPSGELAGKIRSINTQEDLSAEMTAQDDLIEDIMAALQGKAAGGGSGSAPVIRALSITENGTYVAPDGVDGFSPVTVNVEGAGAVALAWFILNNSAMPFEEGMTWGVFVGSQYNVGFVEGSLGQRVFVDSDGYVILFAGPYVTTNGALSGRVISTDEIVPSAMYSVYAQPAGPTLPST